MPLFIVHFKIVGQPTAEEQTNEGEAIRKIFAEGDLRQLLIAEYHVQGWAIWRVESPEVILHKLAALPLRKYMDVTITRLIEPELVADLRG